MNLTPLLYYAKSELGKQGYVMTLEIAKLITNRKPPPDEREPPTQPPESVGRENPSMKIKTPYMGD